MRLPTTRCTRPSVEVKGEMFDIGTKVYFSAYGVKFDLMFY